MSRIGKKPIPVPQNVQVDIMEGNVVKVKGPLGELERVFYPSLSIKKVDNQIIVERPNDEKFMKSIHGTTRALINNMVLGVTQGFEKRLELQGTGYRARVQGNKLFLEVGFSRPIELEIPTGLSVAVQDNTKISIKGTDKELVGKLADTVRKVRPVEPYKGKGIRYEGEKVRQKAGKAGKK
ncbi:MAG TPA: 50S ribosomal protein L6 [Dictyoglomaceae bacterium]|nr:50S ribosomal protein L6 [Dictyoglomaceae bacterium]HOL38823.1 50S ribosomal protein L6 [Dictyoglomaceae bacterium]HOP94473.1 50S ribosomal protein L6 [Dictyoglomaceae bacterium]HPP15429.1 50S ribosomal protein L6 [Dictyoglomaceae bacterium]HPU43205.1 50S ribosomal protein L6 [Dictyoglomaceae bacterium]